MDRSYSKALGPRKAESKPITGTDILWFERVCLAAINQGASDLLIATNDETHSSATIQVRIDGRLHPFLVPGAESEKVAGNIGAATNAMNIRREVKPQSSTLDLHVGDQKRKARVQAFLNHRSGIVVQTRLPDFLPVRPLDQVGMSRRSEELTRELLGDSSRVLIVAGPMGSGKTSTAHSCLHELADGTRSIWTVEDPVERDLPGAHQIEVNDNPKVQAGFDQILPGLVRSDYDTLLVGETRDADTATAVVSQGKVGRQVLTTLHANDGVSALMRLIDLSRESVLHTLESVNAIISQRLIPKIGGGRAVINEVMVINDQIVDTFLSGAPLGQIRATAKGFVASSFYDDAGELVRAGVVRKEDARAFLGESAAEKMARRQRQAERRAASHAQPGGGVFPLPASQEDLR